MNKAVFLLVAFTVMIVGSVLISSVEKFLVLNYWNGLFLL